MADPQSQLEPAGLTPRVVIAPRRADDDHAPTISSPLNPDAATRNKQPKPIVREQREKKDSLKKRESTAARSSAVSQQLEDTRGAFSVPSPMRYTIPTPELSHYNAPKQVAFASHEPHPIFAPDGDTELKKSVDQYGDPRHLNYAYNCQCRKQERFPISSLRSRSCVSA
jgi:COMPASS component BRE2